MSENMKIWDALKRPPPEALKKIGGGRLKGMTDIKPQWRYEAMTEQFGPVGMGWKYAVYKLWTEQGSNEQVMAMAEIGLSVKIDGEWSDIIPGVGGSMLVTEETAGLHTSDEGYKMAVTDALGTAMKMLGVAADIYSGQWDGSKYKEPTHRFKKGEKDAIIEGVRTALEAGDEIGLKQVLDEYTDKDADPEEKMKIWSLFNSTERAAIKSLLKE